MSEATAKATAFVSAHRDEAAVLGGRLAEVIGEPEVFVATLSDGLNALEDPDYTEMTVRVSPDVPAELMVRGPLIAAVQGPLRRALRDGSSMTALHLASRLIAEPQRSLRLFALPCLRRSLAEDPEQSWQLMRRMGRRAGDWIEVDSLADVWARGVLAEGFRWAELEQLVFSERTFERRLVGATLATMPRRVPRGSRGALREGALERALEMIRQLMGDAEVMVQKALSWALREWTPVEHRAVAAFLEAESAIAAANRDGARAWVIRDALVRQPPTLAAALRARLQGIRRDGSVPSTSIASAQAAAFAAVMTNSNEAVAVQGHRYTRSRA